MSPRFRPFPSSLSFVPLVALLVLSSAPLTASAAPDVITHVGVSRSYLQGYEPSSKGVIRPAFSVGVVQSLTRMAALDAELGFAGRGADIGFFDIYSTSGNYYGSRDVRFDLDYVQLPVVLRLTPPAGRLRPVFLAGVDLSVKTGERYVVKDVPELEWIARTDVRRLDWGWIGGAGLELDSPAGTWSLEGRYTLGMTRMQATTFGSGFSRNRDLQLVFGLRQGWPHF